MDEAWKTVQRLQYGSSDFADVAAREELYQMKAQNEYEKRSKTGYLAILNPCYGDYEYRVEVFCCLLPFNRGHYCGDLFHAFCDEGEEFGAVGRVVWG